MIEIIKQIPTLLKVQLLLFFITLILFIFSLFFVGLDGYVLIAASFTLLVMGINNYKQRENKLYAILYIVFALAMFVSGIMEFING